MSLRERERLGWQWSASLRAALAVGGGGWGAALGRGICWAGNFENFGKKSELFF
jgi:F0F1-type ATP synthase membrane subunit c/vacuolar-type H+-ATPase subunit K